MQRQGEREGRREGRAEVPRGHVVSGRFWKAMGQVLLPKSQSELSPVSQKQACLSILAPLKAASGRRHFGTQVTGIKQHSRWSHCVPQVELGRGLLFLFKSRLKKKTKTGSGSKKEMIKY